MSNQGEITELDVNSINFTVVTGADGTILTSREGSLCLQNKHDGSVIFVPPTEALLEAFQLNWAEDPTPSASITESEKLTESEESTNKQRCKWTKEAILQLIDLRRKYENDFKSTTTKNEVTWKRLSEDLRKSGIFMTATQCNDKWRYLKARYTAKKDNMGPRQTGEAPADFPYFEEMDNFLGKKHTIQPPAIASSSRGDTMPKPQDEHVLEDNAESDSDVEPPKKQQKIISKVTRNIRNPKTGLQLVWNDMKKSAVTREENRERRHQEALEVRNKAISVFSDKMDRLIEKLNK